MESNHGNGGFNGGGGPGGLSGPARANMKIVYTVVDRGGKSYWTRIGVGFVNKDGSLNLKLDAMPCNGSLQVREYEPYDPDRAAGAQNGSRSAPATQRDLGSDLPF